MNQPNNIEIIKTDSDSGSWLSNFVRGVKNFDGWTNILAGLNTRAKDARTRSEVSWRRFSEAEFENLYAGDAMAAKIVDMPPDDAMEKGYKIVGLNTQQLETLETKLKSIYFNQSIMEAAKKARLYGGAAILKAYNDDLKLEIPAKDGPKQIKSLIVFQRFELWSTWQDVQKDLLSPDFGCPLIYTFIGRHATTPMNIRIHESRLVRFEGAYLPDALRQANGYWGDSVLGKIYDAIRNYSFGHDSINAALKDLSTAVFKIKHLADTLASNGDSRVLRRLEIVNLTKSIARAVVLDADGEDFDYKVRNLTGAAELVDRAEGRLAAESSFPRTVLFGESPTGGLGQSGNHEGENWYNFIASYQNTYLKPHMLEIIKECCEELSIPSDSLDVEFNPLWQMSEKDMSEVRSRQADTDTKYIDAGVLDPTEIRESRFGGDKYSIETQLDESIGEINPKESEEKENYLNQSKEKDPKIEE